MSLTEVCKSVKAETSEVNRSLCQPLQEWSVQYAFLLLCCIMCTFFFVIFSCVIFNIYICCSAWALVFFFAYEPICCIKFCLKTWDSAQDTGKKKSTREKEKLHKTVNRTLKVVIFFCCYLVVLGKKNCTEMKFSLCLSNSLQRKFYWSNICSIS